MEFYGQFKDSKPHGEGAGKIDGKLFKLKYEEGELIEETEMWQVLN